MNKATIKLKEYENWIKSIDLKEFNKTYCEFFMGRWNEHGVKLISDAYSNQISTFFNEVRYIYNFDDIEIIDKYVTEHNFKYDLIIKDGIYCVVKYGNKSLFIVDDFITIFEEPNYEDYSLQEVKNKLLSNKEIREESNSISLISNISIKDNKEKQKSIYSKMDEIKQQLEDVKNNRNEELLKIQKEIDEKLALLNEKKAIMQAELNEKMLEFNKQLDNLKKQILMLKTEIYAIRCFAGETVELIQLRSGKNVNSNNPLIINQKILYLDEDLARTMSIYSDDIETNYTLLEEALKYNDLVLETFCPQEKSISFFKLSKSNKTYSYNIKEGLLEYYSMLHGTKMGFIVRNGENVYCGWLPEVWDIADEDDNKERHLTFNDSVIYKPGIREVDVNDTNCKDDTNPEHAISRYFAINVIQGLISHKHILDIPKDVNILKPNKYIILNYADNWIDDNRYGLFVDLVKNLKEYTKVGDMILVINNVSENNYKINSGNRSVGYRNTTRDASIESGIYKVSLIKDNEIFVSAPRNTWMNDAINNANLKVYDNEFINITYMNSIWLKYFIDTKKIGSFGFSSNGEGYGYSNIDYSYLIKYFKLAYKEIINRESSEYEEISKFVDLSHVNNWQEKLSHWKIINNVRNITPFQAKRVSKYFSENNYYEVANLFKSNFDEEQYNDLGLKKYYFVSNVKWSTESQSRYWIDDKDLLKTSKAKYFAISDNEYASDRFNDETSIEEFKNREEFDLEKLKCIYYEVVTELKKYNIEFNDDKLIEYATKPLRENNRLNSNDIWINIIKSGAWYNINIIDFDSKYKQDMIDTFNNASYYWYRNMPEKYYNLMYLIFLQTKIYFVIANAIGHVIHYRNIHKKKYINEGAI